MWVKTQNGKKMIEVNLIEIEMKNPHKPEEGYFLSANGQHNLGIFMKYEDAQDELDDILSAIKMGHKAFVVKIDDRKNPQ